MKIVRFKFIPFLLLILANNAAGGSTGIIWEENAVSVTTKNSNSSVFKFNGICRSVDGVELKSVTTSCGCAVVPLKKMKYKQGERVVLKGTVNRRRIKRGSEYTVLVESNAGVDMLKAIATEEAISIDPQILIWEKNAESNAKSSKIKINADKKIKEILPPQESRHFKVVSNKRDKNSFQWTFDITPKSTNSPVIESMEYNF